MCTFSESSRVRLGNAVMYIAARAKYPYKTEVLKLLFLMEERMGLIDLKAMRENLHQMVREVYARP